MVARVLLFAMSVALAAAVYLGRSERPGVNGDEPHYLVMADSVARDLTLDLRNAYGREAATHQIYGGSIRPHVRKVEHRWAPYHGPGLALLLALPMLVAGTVGAKVALCLLAGLLPVSLHRFFAERAAPEVAMWLAAGITIALPFCFGASQVYPDLVAGVVATVLALWLIRGRGRAASVGMWALFWVVTGVLPWLNSKYLATTAALAIGGLGTAWQASRDGRTDTVWRTVATGLLVAVGPLGLAAFHIWGVGTPIGPRGLGEVASNFSRASMMFLGLHFDQSQGMFVQHPLLLAGVAAWPMFARRRPRLAAFWLLLYASLIVPNSLELARWGVGGPVGRFMWSAAWLWAVPLGLVIADHQGMLERYVKPAVVLSLVYQALLAVRWLPNLRLLYPRLEEQLDARDSLFPLALRPFLPSFSFWDFSSYWTYPPNVVAYGVFIGLIALGTWAALHTLPQDDARQGNAAPAPIGRAAGRIGRKAKREAVTGEIAAVEREHR